MGIFSNRVEKTELEAGDHIYTWRRAFIYAHHGIYIGEGKVVHFTQDSTKFQLGGITNIASCANSTALAKTRAFGCTTCEAMGLRKKTGGVVMTCLDCFLGSGSLYRFQYGVSMLAFVFKLRGGICHFTNCDPPQTVLDRAMKLLQDGFGDYHVFAKILLTTVKLARNAAGTRALVKSLLVSGAQRLHSITTTSTRREHTMPISRLKFSPC